MTNRRAWLVMITFALALIFAAPNKTSAAPTIDIRVLEDTANGKVGRFLVVLKVQANVRGAAARAPTRAARGRAVFEVLRETARQTQPAVRAQLDAIGAKHRAHYVANVIAVEGNRAVVDAMAARADVLAIESDRAFRVNLETPRGSAPAAPAAVEWNVAKVNAPQVWAQGYTGQGRVYGNADTGVQWEHPALKGKYRGWNGTSADHNYNWWDAIHADLSGNGTNPCDGFSLPVPCDDLGHGTHTLGTGIGDDGSGNQIGVAPGAKWIACRNMEQGFGTPSTYLECFDFFLAPTDLSGNNPDPSKAPDVVGNSYACPPVEGCVDVNILLTAMDNLRAAGIFMSVSAGNSGSSCSTINEPPAIYDSSITVGATDSGDQIAAFSSRGAVSVDGSNRRKPDLVAPGVSVRSSYPTNTYAFLSGTSMASPHVAGAVVVLWSRFPQIVRDVDATEMVLTQTAIPLTTSQGCGGDSSSAVPNNVYGYGRLDILAAFNYADSIYFPFKYIFPLVFR